MSGSVQVKKIITLIILVVFCFSGCTVSDNGTKNIAQSDDKAEYVKAVWITYYELSDFTTNKTKTEFSSNISKVFKNLHNIGFNTVIVQVRPCADAFYNSDFFPVSEYFNGKQGSELIFDPLEIMCDLAHKNNLKIEAWLNPYRVSQSDDVSKLSDNNIAKKWYEEKNNYVVACDKKLFFNPACKEVNELIVNGVEEIVKNYDVDAIHFDDYFYPTSKESFDKKEYEEYKKKKGTLPLADWRRENVSNLIKSVYSAVKKTKQNVKFGVSPASDLEKNYNSLYADIQKWVCEEGYIDYICPQIYFGFRNIYQPFMRTVKKWRKLCENTKVELYIGLPLYKSGKIDEYAGDEDEAKNEFVENTNIISRQIKYIEKLDKINGYFVFSYSCLNDKKLENEVSKMYEAMQSSSPLLHQPKL